MGAHLPWLELKPCAMVRVPPIGKQFQQPKSVGSLRTDFFLNEGSPPIKTVEACYRQGRQHALWIHGFWYAPSFLFGL